MDPKGGPKFERDPYTEFATKGFDLIERQVTQLALLEQRLAAIEARDAECRCDQEKNHKKADDRLKSIEETMHVMSAQFSRHVDADERYVKHEEGSRMRSTQIWVAIIGMLAVVLSSAWGARSVAQSAAQTAAASAKVQVAVNELLNK